MDKRSRTATHHLTFHEWEDILNVLPDSIIVCDQEGKILQMNAAAFQLFEIAPDFPYQGSSYQQFLRLYEMHDEQQRLSSIEQWPINLTLADNEIPHSSAKIRILHMPSGREIYVYLWRFPLLDAHKHTATCVYVFRDITHRYQKALHLQRVHQAMLSLIQAIVQVPPKIDFPLSEETPLLSPPLLLISQQLVDMIHEVLDCRLVSLWALGSAANMYYVTGSGLTVEQEQRRRRYSGAVSTSDMVRETVIAQLQANQVVIIPEKRLRPLSLPPSVYDGDFSAEEKWLIVPLFLKQQLAGGLFINKGGTEREYRPEEIEVAKLVAAQVALIMECLLGLRKQTETKPKALLLQEVNRLATDFLTLAGHELLTPLTGIYGNLQLAQRRLKTLQGQIAAQPEGLDRHMEHIQQSLLSATQSAQLQQRMINDLIDDTRLQTNTLNLCMKQCDLITLIKEAVAGQQQSISEGTIILELPPTERVVPIVADAERIIQVLNTYLMNALRSAPATYPVIVQLTIEDATARVTVHDEGLGIPLEEQAHIWERFYQAKSGTIQYELKPNFGLGLYLCRALIELHNGRVGIQSALGQGTSFWFTLPIARSPVGECG